MAEPNVHLVSSVASVVRAHERQLEESRARLAKEIRTARARGASLKELAEATKLSDARVSQICRASR